MVPKADAVVDPLGMYDSVLEVRTNRRQFAADEVPVEIVESLQQAAENEGATLLPFAAKITGWHYND